MADEQHVPANAGTQTPALAPETAQTVTAHSTRPPSVSSGDVSNEKAPKVTTASAVDLEKPAEKEGYVLDEARLRERFGLAPDVPLKKSPKGDVLIPQPTDDPEDPLNWSRVKKAATLLVIGWTAAMSDYSAATGGSALLAQAETWHISPNEVNHATAGMTFMLGVGGIFSVWLSAWIGRLPVLFWTALLAAATAAWSAAAQTFESYMASRILNGMFVVAGAAGGLMWIKDVWFFHQHARKINVWSTAIILSPFLGPQFMAAILSVSSWRTGMWLNFGIITMGLILVVSLGDETFYPRHLSADQVPRRQNRLLRVIGVEQYKQKYTTNSFLEAGSRLMYPLMKLPIFLTCFFYFFDCKSSAKPLRVMVY
jgi:MFS family permease